MPKRKPEHELVTIKAPADIIAGAYRAADSRCGAFLRRWLTYQLNGAELNSPETSIQQLVRNVYLQGVNDGFELGYNLAVKENFDGLGTS